MQRGFNSIIKVVSVPIAAQITILPIMVKNYNTISLTFLISNIIAMPLLEISIIGGYLLIIFSFVWIGGAKQIGVIFNLILKGLIIIAKFCGNLKLSNIYVITPSIITIIIYYIVIVVIIYLFEYKSNFITGTTLAARRGFIFLSNAWRKKISNPDEMRRTYEKNIINYFINSTNNRNSIPKL